MVRGSNPLSPNILYGRLAQLDRAPVNLFISVLIWSHSVAAITGACHAPDRSSTLRGTAI